MYFLMGWVVYGMVLDNMMNVNPSIMLADEDVRMEFIAISCLIAGLLVAYVLLKANISDWKTGAITAMVIGVLISISVGFSMNAMYNFSSMNDTLLDAIGSLLCFGGMGAVTGWYFGRK
ncbi:MAG: hypothetical protein KDC49_10535 [Saprospiraceae bacterium]|nr:hypothetical protein [Saprospiraceae bacterium]